MARISLFRPFNIDRISVDGDDITIANSRLIRQNDGFERTDYQGSFNVSGTTANPNISGTLREIDYFRGGSQVLEVTGLSKDASRVADLIGAERTSAFLKFILSGNDTFTGSTGNDKLRGFNGSDNMSGNRGSDTLIGGGNSDTLKGGGGSDVLSGGGANDTLLGGGGSDRLNGGGGNDVLNGGKGSDILKGGGGSDRFIFRAKQGDDRIRDFQQGQDKIVIKSGADSFDDLTITGVDGDVHIEFADVTITVDDAFVGTFDASDFIF